MTGLLYGDPHDSTTLEAMGVDALERGAGEVAGAVARRAFALMPEVRFARQLAAPGPDPEAQAHWRSYRDPLGRNENADAAAIAAERGDEPTILAPADANARFGLDGKLKFDKPVSEAVARDLHDGKRDRLADEDIIKNRPDSLLTGWAGRTGIELAIGLLSPINVASAFIPFVGQARAAAWVAGASGTAGRIGARAGIGAIEGAAGMAVLEPLNYAFDQREQNDWHMSEALQNIALGGLLGGGLHVAMRYPRGPLTARLDRLAPEERAALLQVGVAQHLGDAPTNVAPLLDTAELRSAYADRLAARGDTGAGNYASYTPEGLRVELRPEVVEAGSLIASHDGAGAVNPAFPHAQGMQPRDRTSAASQAQIVEMASRLEPERLGPSPEASTGSPIVNAGHVVESGNGRIMALRRVYSDPALKQQAEAYRAFLVARGHDIEGMAQPVLIGRRVTQFGAEETHAFVRGANERATLGMNAAEQARLDSGRAGKAAQAYRPGPLTGRDNQGFVAAFMAQIPAEERAAMILTDGRLSGPGESRIRMALLAHAYGDALGPTLERVLNGDVEHMKGIAGALTDMAGAWSQMRGAAARGEIPAGLDITASIGEAVQLLDRARSSGTPIAALLAQTDMMNAPSPAALALLRLMFRDEAMRQPVGRQRLTELLDRYVEQAMEAKPGKGLFGEPETTAADILRSIAGDDARVRNVADALTVAAKPDAGDLPEHAAVSREAETTAKAAAQDHVGEGAEASMFDDLPEKSKPVEIDPPAPRPALAAPPGRFTGEGQDGLLRLEGGSTTLGSIPDGLAIPSGPIVAPRGWHDAESGKGGGLAHIEAQHGAEIQQGGWRDVADFVADMAATFTEIRSRPDGSAFLIVRNATRSGPRDPQTLIVVGLAREGDAWRVITGGRFKNNYIEKAELLWRAEHPTAPRPNGQVASSSSPPQEASASAGALSARGQSAANIGTNAAEGKFRDASPELQEAMRLADRHVAAVQREFAAGRLTEADLAPLRAADEGLAKAETRAQAAEAAAACLLATGAGA